MKQIKACCESIARSGFGTLQISDAMQQDYKKIIDGYAAISQTTKQSFSFAEDTDGFSLLAPSIRASKTTRTCVSVSVTGLRMRLSERIWSSPEARSSLLWVVLSARSASSPKR